MPVLRQATVRNRLLRALSPSDFALLQPHLTTVETELRQTLVTPDEPIHRLFFPEIGYGSVVADGLPGKSEIGIVGREGLIGATPVLLGADRTPHHVFVQAPGEMLAIEAAALMAACNGSASLRGLLLLYIQTQIVQLGRTAYSNATYRIEVRLARWLLMCHDRTEGDELIITHEFLALMLGIRRSSATLAVQEIEGDGMIRAKRGRVIIRDRASLIALADGSYGAPEAEYARLIEGA